MGKFINTTRKDTIDSLVHGLKNRLDNPYYLHSNASPTIVNYYSTNLERTTLDQGLKTEYEQIGSSSPFKYNLIKNFYLYGGLERIQVDLDIDDISGLTASQITSRSAVLPNIGMTPAVGDHFEITYMDNKYIFEVITVNTDKLENQSNMYEIEYELTDITNKEIMDQVAGIFIMNIDNIGTSLRVIIREDAYNLIEILDDASVSLKSYFMNIFFSPRVETFVYTDYRGQRFYDPHLIEFIIRNDILTGSIDYIHVMQQMAVSSTFNIDYNNTFFRSLEMGSINKLKDNIYGWGKHINQPTSILSMHQEDYFEVKHINKGACVQNTIFEIFNEELIERIKRNILYPHSIHAGDGVVLTEKYFNGIVTYVDNKIGCQNNCNIHNYDSELYDLISNIIIRYFNDFEITKDDIDLLEDMDYYNGGSRLYYLLPIVIFIIERYILKYLSNPVR